MKGEDTQQGKPTPQETSRGGVNLITAILTSNFLTIDMIDKCLAAYSLECSWQGKGHQCNSSLTQLLSLTPHSKWLFSCKWHEECHHTLQLSCVADTYGYYTNVNRCKTIFTYMMCWCHRETHNTMPYSTDPGLSYTDWEVNAQGRLRMHHFIHDTYVGMWRHCHNLLEWYYNLQKLNGCYV